MPELPIETVERAVYEICPQINSGTLSIDDAQALGAKGFSIDPADDEGKWASTGTEAFLVRIGTDSSKPGCRVQYVGKESAVVYEKIRERALSKAFVYPGGKRKPPELQFIMDTLVADTGSIGIISMFRVLMSGADSFAMTVFPPAP